MRLGVRQPAGALLLRSCTDATTSSRIEGASRNLERSDERQIRSPLDRSAMLDFYMTLSG